MPHDIIDNREVKLSEKVGLMLDNVTIDIICLTEDGREAVYKAIVDLVSARLGKARSV